MGDQTQAPATLPGNLIVHPWMNGMNHGTTPVTINQNPKGIWDVTQVYYLMDGPWYQWIGFQKAGESADPKHVTGYIEVVQVPFHVDK